LYCDYRSLGGSTVTQADTQAEANQELHRPKHRHSDPGYQVIARRKERKKAE